MGDVVAAIFFVVVVVVVVVIVVDDGHSCNGFRYRVLQQLQIVVNNRIEIIFTDSIFFEGEREGSIYRYIYIAVWESPRKDGVRLETGLFSENRQYIYPSYRVQDSQMGSVIQRAKSWTMEPDVRGVECCFLIGASRCGRSQVVDAEILSCKPGSPEM